MDSGLVLRTPRNDGSGCQTHSQLHDGQIKTRILAIPHLLEGRIAIVTDVGAGCGGRSSIGRAMCSQGGFRERATARRRPALKRLGEDFFRQHMSRSKRSG